MFFLPRFLPDFARRYFFLAALMPLLAAAQTSQLPEAVQRALSGAKIPVANVAVVVQALDAPAPLISHNARQAMNPASVMKLVTTFAALDLLGPAYTWQTRVSSDAPAVNGVLPGNLYLQGSGDPQFGSEHLWQLLRQLRARGIERITGDIVLDRSVFAAVDFDPAAFDGKPLRPYNVGPNGLLLDFQALRFTVQPGEAQVVNLFLDSPVSGFALDNQLRLLEGACADNWRDRIQLNLTQTQNGPRLTASGDYARQCGERSLSLAPLSADAHAASLIVSLWQELGGRLGGRVRAGETPAVAQLLLRHDSLPLSQAVLGINKFSNNVMARQVFLSLDAGTAPASTAGAGRRIQVWLTALGLDCPELVLDNGSGLSRRERISAASLNALLRAAWQRPAMPEFLASLPLAGIDGTMKKRLKDSPASGRARIKTGYLNGVRAAAGYVFDRQGGRYAVSIMINDPRAADGAAAIDALLDWLAEGGR
ncbi:D-alanyl-D-alanine carboxypeptidase/D-alanyl-D-alanine-endopeptidase [Azonexus sp.]|uniref:D-alanyl-D-alanine carboxypeptidase/D-alanyl-D-alanine endopeptidase n=1 Tax=Azonexus sp. TaxID=1872668 RepID=UPI0039E4CD6F